jgi:hypothetical protein
VEWRFAQNGWQEMDASSRRSSEMVKHWRGLCPAVDCKTVDVADDDDDAISDCYLLTYIILGTHGVLTFDNKLCLVQDVLLETYYLVIGRRSPLD